MFYSLKVIWALVPVAMTLACMATWGAIRACSSRCPITHYRRKVQASCVALLFLIYPNLCTESMNLFACRTVCGDLFLLADLDERCWVGRHADYVLGLGLPMLLLWVVGLPVTAWLRVRKMRKIASSASRGTGSMKDQVDQHFVFGLFYTSYREDMWWWEATVTFRKIVVAAITVFGRSAGALQVHVSSAVIGACLVATSLAHPYAGDRKTLHVLELIALGATWLLLWAGTIFFSFPRCENPEAAARVQEDGRRMEVKTEAWCDALSLGVGGLGFGVAVGLVVWFLRFKISKATCRRALSCAETRAERQEREGQGEGEKEEEEEVMRIDEANNEDQDVAARRLRLHRPTLATSSVEGHGVELAARPMNPLYRGGGGQGCRGGTAPPSSPLSTAAIVAPTNATRRVNPLYRERDESSSSATLVAAKPSGVMGVSGAARQTFARYTTENGADYFVPTAGGTAVWRLPEGGVVVAGTD